MTATTDDPPRSRPAEHPVRVHELVVLRSERVTPGMLRVVLGGPDVAEFEHHVPDERVKLVFPDPDTGLLRPPRRGADASTLDWPRPFPPTREYSIRRHDAVAGEVSIDFVLHPGGLASNWAESAEPDDRLWVVGPRPGVVVPPEFTFQLLLADQTGLPALARWLDVLPPGVRAQAVIQVPDAAERQDLAVRSGVTVRWLLEDDPGHTVDALGDALAAAELPDDEHVYLWAAGEAAAMKPIRRWARDHGFDRRNCDIAGYWRRGFGTPR